MIKNFEIGKGAFPVDGEVLPDTRALQDNLYLLNEGGEVISAREARPLVTVGENFFAALQTTPGELEAMERGLKGLHDTMYLMQCGPLPVLAMRYLWRGERTLLAAVPKGTLARALRTPAAYDGVLFQGDLEFSPLSAAKRMPPDEEVFRAAQEWIAPYRFLRAAKEELVPDTRNLMQFLISRTVTLAKLVGVHALYYYSDMLYTTVINVNYPLLMARLSAVMMAIRRVAREQTAHFTIKREGDGDPEIYVSFYLDGDGALPELTCGSRLTGCESGVSFFANPTVKELYHIRFSFCTKPVEEMGLHASDYKLQNVK